MAELVFHTAANRKLRHNIDNAVLYVGTGWKGVAWDGMTKVSTNPDGGDLNKVWADGIAYASLRGAVSYAASISCVNFPLEFDACIGNVQIGTTGVYAHEQNGEVFRLAYRERLTNAEKGDYGYRYHVVYNCMCDPSDSDAETDDDSIDAQEFQFDIKGTPITCTVGGKTINASEYTFDVNDADLKTNKIVQTLYGTTSADAACPDPDTLFKIS